MTNLWQALNADCASTPRGTIEWRALSGAETVARVRPIATAVGVTRLADITGLDCLGLPVFQAVRPASRNISVSLGKGLTADLSRASALMEAIECQHAERLAAPDFSVPLRAVSSALGYDPNELLPGGPAAQSHRLATEEVLAWVPATSLTTGRDSFVPRQLCELDFSARSRTVLPRFAATSNGLASGNTISEALLHGLCEVIERDCLAASDLDGLAPERALDLPSAPWPELSALLARLERAGAALHVFDQSGAIAVPCYDAFLSMPDFGTFRGLGCHPDPFVALLRAVLESAQGRLAHIAGSRDDLCRQDYEQRAVPARKRDWPPGVRRVPQSSPAQRATLSETVLWLARAVERQTGNPPLAVDLTRPEWGLPVVFCIAPGLRPPRVAQRVVTRLKPLPVPARASSPARARVAAFVGPTITGDELRARLAGVDADIDVYPPVQQGDLYRLLADPPSVALVVDGEFMQVPALLHKEVLALLARGVRVLGAGSMGALRAAELCAFGMEGFGAVFEQYRRGLEGDDEVAVAHLDAAQAYRPLTFALVNLRFQLETALAQSVVDPVTAGLVLSAARALHFSERTLAGVFRCVRGHGSAQTLDALFEWLRQNPLDRKRADALLMLDELSLRLRGARAWPAAAEAPPVATKYSQAQANSYVGVRIGNVHVPHWFVLAFDSLVSRDFPRFCRDVKFELLSSLAPHSVSSAGHSRRSLLERAVAPSGVQLVQAWRALRMEPNIPFGSAVLAESQRSGRFARITSALEPLLSSLPAATCAAAPTGARLRRYVAKCWRVPLARLDDAAEQRGFTDTRDVLPAASILFQYQSQETLRLRNPARAVSELVAMGS